ncbi:hypothetical protein KR038_008331 [Drosophila bunnanda]|nr:hypothetical protein KR038_008331 [Drosophila bunnanda]
MLNYLSQSIWSHPCLWLFATMQVTLMMSMMHIVIKIELSFLVSPLARARLEYNLSDLAYSPLLSGCAASSLSYGYGLVYLKVNGRLDSFLSRIRRASLRVWDWCAPLMFLPWLMRVGENLLRFPFYKVENAIDGGVVNFRMHAILAVFTWHCVFFLTVICLLMALELKSQLIRCRRVRIADPEILDYARRINELTGFEIIRLDT